MSGGRGRIQAVLRKPLAVGAWSRSQCVYLVSVVDQETVQPVRCRVFQFSPVSVTPPVARTESFITHRRYIILLFESVVK